MGKTTSLIESQHHHLLHCLEKTTVSARPPSPTPALSEVTTHTEPHSHPHPGPASGVEICPLQIQRVEMRSLSTPRRGAEPPRQGQLCPACRGGHSPRLPTPLPVPRPCLGYWAKGSAHHSPVLRGVALQN